VALASIQPLRAPDLFLYVIQFIHRAGAYLALSGAAAVGPKRLSSDTYQQLNKLNIVSASLQLWVLSTGSRGVVNVLMAVGSMLEVLVSALGLKAAMDYFNANNKK
jgi:hypothetical protein